MSSASYNKQFSNRFQGKQDFVTKDGHYGIVSNTKNPIQKVPSNEYRQSSQGSMGQGLSQSSVYKEHFAQKQSPQKSQFQQ